MHSLTKGGTRRDRLFGSLVSADRWSVDGAMKRQIGEAIALINQATTWGGSHHVCV